MNITLRAGERFFINGAVIRIDRKASIELLNEVTFLLENHVMQAEAATTLVRQIYFAVQIMLMDPTAAGSAAPLARSLIESALGAYRARVDVGPQGRRRVARPRSQFRGAEGAPRPLRPRGQ
jgi:flagellar biosynthesis repressor protein FlbT